MQSQSADSTDMLFATSVVQALRSHPQLFIAFFLLHRYLNDPSTQRRPAHQFQHLVFPCFACRLTGE